jgi:dihydroorotate dehydrogenase
MPDLTTTYLGLKLQTPIIVGSSGLTDKPEKNVMLEKYGAGAVVKQLLAGANAVQVVSPCTKKGRNIWKTW